MLHSPNGLAHPLLYQSSAMRRVVELIDRLAPTDLPVLLIGETGTGKELLAERLHRASRRTGDFVDVNCGALPPDLVEGLLFGHAKGAFTGAVASSRGLVSRADRGTLFLDELSSLPVEGQATLLRVLDTGELRPLGGGAKVRVNFRVIAAVHTDLGACIAAGAFRADLFYRVAGAVVEVPPLHARPDDILLLAGAFARDCNRQLEPAAEAVLQAYSWPGNVRELRAVIHRASLASCHSAALCAGALCAAISSGTIKTVAPRRPRPGTLPGAAQLLELCAACEWRVERIAHALGASRATAYRRLHDHGIQLPKPERSSRPRASVTATSSHSSHSSHETCENSQPPFPQFCG